MKIIKHGGNLSEKLMNSFPNRIIMQILKKTI